MPSEIQQQLHLPPQRPLPGGKQPRGGAVYCVMLIDVLMMGVAVTAVALAQPALALIAGSSCVSLSARLARWLLP